MKATASRLRPTARKYCFSAGVAANFIDGILNSDAGAPPEVVRAKGKGIGKTGKPYGRVVAEGHDMQQPVNIAMYKANVKDVAPTRVNWTVIRVAFRNLDESQRLAPDTDDEWDPTEGKNWNSKTR